MAEEPRRFPPPWHADPMPGGYVVRDANGQALAYVYSRGSEVEARQAKVLTTDEGRRIAANIARLPELLGKASGTSRSRPGSCYLRIGHYQFRKMLVVASPDRLRGSGRSGRKEQQHQRRRPGISPRSAGSSPWGLLQRLPLGSDHSR
jgi:hypothetical protein